jgi:hypothetical protein
LNGRSERVVKDRAVSIVGNSQFILLLTWWEDVGKGDVDNGWRFEIPVLSSLELALPSRRVLHYLY